MTTSLVLYLDLMCRSFLSRASPPCRSASSPPRPLLVIFIRSILGKAFLPQSFFPTDTSDILHRADRFCACLTSQSSLLAAELLRGIPWAMKTLPRSSSISLVWTIHAKVPECKRVKCLSRLHAHHPLGNQHQQSNVNQVARLPARQC